MLDRRKFLGRSVLSAGSVLFSSTLLESCRKYGIPFPDGNHHHGGGENTPPLLDYQIDWNDAAKIAVKTGLEMIPEAGEFLGPLAEIFWPKSKEDVWGEVKAQTEALVNQKISDLVYRQVTEDLGKIGPSPTGLVGALTFYKNEVNNGTPGEILSQWMTTRTAFAGSVDHFQSAGNELPLLGLFVQFANMYLGLLRDGVAFGQSWGRTLKDHQDDIDLLKTTISAFTTYTTNTYNVGRFNVLKTIKQPYDKLHNEPFNTLNKYDRQMTLTILDFMDTWQYYDITLYPDGARNVDGTPIRMITHEIYSDPMGSIDNSTFEDLVIALPPPTQPPRQLSIWGGPAHGYYGVPVNAVQVTYPAGSGPGGVTQTPRMGAQNVGSNQPPYGALVDISPDNPVVEVQCTYTTYLVDRFQLTFYDGTKTNVGGTGDPNPTTTTNWIFYNDLMSSIYINGASYIAGGQAAACIVFGFQDWQPPSATLKAIRNIYVTSPKERSAADFAKAFPWLAVPANLITPELMSTRMAHWAYIKRLAEDIG